MVTYAASKLSPEITSWKFPPSTAQLNVPMSTMFSCFHFLSEDTSNMEQKEREKNAKYCDRDIIHSYHFHRQICILYNDCFDSCLCLTLAARNSHSWVGTGKKCGTFDLPVNLLGLEHKTRIKTETELQWNINVFSPIYFLKYILRENISNIHVQMNITLKHIILR